ncbi:hypothetical protein CRENBAI_017671 [Crenichthys baileyi]|uniref:Cadherin domain-containing protein n=1 Tax=Crenichthys baileyi TaxID=28760 RepID=A0AAV9RJ89_9TELE
MNATDVDEGVNGEIEYKFGKTLSRKVYDIFELDKVKGEIVVKGLVDYEEKNVYELDVEASDKGTPPLTDSGSPSLSSNVTVNVFILDQNDNAPVILYPVSSNGSAEGVEEIPRNVNAGHLVTKVRAYDADIGYNGWLLFSLQEVTDHSLFGLDRYTGQIRTLRSFTETDEAEHKLVILVKDNGNVSLSATATVTVKLVEPKEAFAASDVKSAAKDDEDNNVTFYLMITLGSVSVLFIISIIVLIAMQCSKSTDYTSKYLPETNYDGTLCHSIQYRSGDKRYMLVGPRMSIGSTIVPGSHANTLVLPDRRRASQELIVGKQAVAQNRYSVPEEVKDGTVVGNVAKDLGLDISSLSDRRFRVISGSKDAFFEVNQNNGILYVHRKIDREELCEGRGACLLELKILVENPLEMHYVAVDITDVNDHSPSFPEKEQTIEIAEHTLPGRRFQLHAARDPDAGINSIRTYILTQNDHFEIDIRESDGDKIPFLVLKRALDREQKDKHSLVVTALDGGKPSRSGTLNVSVIVLDINDNRPAFLQDTYQISVKENLPLGSLIFVMNATDPDEGTNGEIEYSLAKTLRKNVYDLFELNKLSGEIKVKGALDYEQNDVFKLVIEASDKGTPPLTGECRLNIKLKDVNDNPPEIEITSQSNTVSEDSIPGTVISLLSVTDKDSGLNGKIVASIISNGPFELKPSYKENIYSVVTKGVLDREEVSNYELTIKATDCGEPNLSSSQTFSIQISDVNDNNPQFPENPLQFYLSENNGAGNSIFSVSAKDKDQNENAAISYRIGRELNGNDIMSRLNINSDNGQIFALKSFDFETLKTFQFQVVASDSGSPSLSSNVTVNVFILDQNDNAPVILYPVSSNGSAEGVEEIPRNVNAGHSVTKVRAYDADIGYNGWLLFSLQEVTDHSLFGLDRYTGQIRTLRSFTETDEAEHKLVILVKDNGNVSLSATATVIVKLVEPKEAFAASDVKSAAKDDEDNNVTFYLMITLGSVSVLFIISIIVLIAMQCSKSTDYTSKYLPETNYDGTLCHSIQYRSGDKRYMLVGPRMSIGSTIVPGSHANTLVLPDRRRTSEEFQVVASDSGSPSLSSNVTVNLFILDQNDNAPVILYPVSSNGSAEGVEEIPRNVNAGHLVTKVRAYDADIGYNGWLLFSLQEVTDHSLFGLDRYTGQIRTLRSFTETDEAEHKLVILVKDNGNVSLSATATVIVKLCSKSTDYTSKYLPETNYDGTLCHSIQYRSGDKRYMLVGPRMSIGSTIVPGSHANTLVLPDRRRTCEEQAVAELRYSVPEEAKEATVIGNIARDLGLEKAHLTDRRLRVVSGPQDTFFDVNTDNGALQFQVVASDSGSPSLSSNVTVNVFILDQNDNAPVILYPVSSNGSAEGVEEIPRNVNAGHLVTKVRAYDADIGYNGWLLFSLQEVTDHSLFGLDRYTGQIRTLRSFTEDRRG